MEVNGEIGKSLSVEFPLSLCRFRPLAAPVTLFYCATGISKVAAQLVLPDGTPRSIVLPNNFEIELERVTTDGSSRTSSYLQASVGRSHQVATGVLDCR